MRLLRLIALAGWAVCAAAPAAEPIRIGVSGPFTGGSSPMGISMRDGIRIAAAEINAAGGLLGRPLQLVERDDRQKSSHFRHFLDPCSPHDRNVKIGKRDDLFQPAIRLP